MRPYRLRALNRKPTAKPYPFLPADAHWILELDGVPRLFASFSRTTWRGQRSDARLDRVCLDALHADYAFKASPATLPESRVRFSYTAVYHDQGLDEAARTLMQLGIRARCHMLVTRERLCSVLVETDRPVPHVLGQFLPGLRSVKPREMGRILSGRSIHARRLKRLTLPALPGIAGSSEPVLPMPILEETMGPNIVLGDVLSPLTGQVLASAELRLDRLMRGVLVAGTTGSGKTNTVLHVIRQIRDHGWVLVLDVKREYRCLMPSGARVLGFRGRNLFTHNLLKPVGDAAQYAKEFASILSEVIHRHSPAVGSKDVVIQELDRLYRERGVYEGSRNYPHVGDLVSALEARERGGREAGWVVSALRVLRSLLVGSTRDAFCVREGQALERLFSGVTVLEVDGLGDSAAEALLASVLLQKVRHHFLNEDPAESLRGVVVVEEAQHLLAQGTEASSVVTTTCREIRATGIGLVMVTQMPSEFSKHALANVNTLVVHRMLHPPDRALVARMMGLPSESQRVFGELSVGRCVAYTDQVLLVDVPETSRPLVRDTDLPATRVEREEIATSHARRRDVENRVVDLREDEWQVLDAVATGHAIYPTGLQEALGLSARRVDAALGALIRKGLLRYKPAKKEGPGRPRLVHFATPAGEEAYRSRHGRYADRSVERSRNHAEVVQEVCQQLGIQRLPHRRFDILYEEDGRQVAIEVETGSNNNRQLTENLVKSLEFQGEARFVCMDKVTMNRILQAAARHCYDHRISVMMKAAAIDQRLEWLAYHFEDRHSMK